MMKKFIVNVFKFVTPLIFTVSILLWYFGQPPLIHSNSVSLNAKINDIRKNYPKSNLDVLSFGSSMNLNNLNSEVIVNNYGGKYLNISSWGQNMGENYNLMKIFIPYYNPKLIFISGNYMDFISSNIDINYGSIKSYIYNSSFNNNINPFNKKSIDFYRLSYYRKDNYNSLNYDKNGGVNYPKKGFKINNKRWVGSEIRKPELKQYKYLDSILKYCNDNEVKLIYIQSPFRSGFISKISPGERTIIKNHIHKLDSILNNNNAFFINSLKVDWSDSLFVDISHLHKEGAMQYTNFAINNFKLIYKNSD